MFEFPGRYYEVIRSGFRDLAGETALLAGLLPTAGHVLDLGCGTGTNLRELAALGHSGVGVDQSAAFIEFAKGAGGSGLQYVHSSFLSFETDETFDVVHCLFATLNLVPPAELPALFAKVRSWLKPGGKFVLEAAHLLNFVDSFQPSSVNHHQSDDLLITRLVKASVNAHTANWRNEETLLVSDAGEVSLHPNFFDQWVLTAPELHHLLNTAGFTVESEFGSFRGTPPPPFGRGPLIQVAT